MDIVFQESCVKPLLFKDLSPAEIFRFADGQNVLMKTQHNVCYNPAGAICNVTYGYVDMRTGNVFERIPPKDYTRRVVRLHTDPIVARDNKD